MRITRLRESSIMCNEPECLSAAFYLVDGRGGRKGKTAGLFAAYCEQHVQPFLLAAKASEETNGTPRKRTAAGAAGVQSRHCA